MKTKKQIWITESPEETKLLAESFAKTLKAGTVICFDGELGSGKTTFIKGLASGLGLKDASSVKSPTFVLMHIYKTKIPLYHFDCYRLNDLDELENIGFSEFISDSNAISCIEWASRAGNLIPSHAQTLCFKVVGETRRKIEFLP